MAKKVRAQPVTEQVIKTTDRIYVYDSFRRLQLVPWKYKIPPLQFIKNLNNGKQ